MPPVTTVQIKTANNPSYMHHQQICCIISMFPLGRCGSADAHVHVQLYVRTLDGILDRAQVRPSRIDHHQQCLCCPLQSAL